MCAAVGDCRREVWLAGYCVVIYKDSRLDEIRASDLLAIGVLAFTFGNVCLRTMLIQKKFTQNLMEQTAFWAARSACPRAVEWRSRLAGVVHSPHGSELGRSLASRCSSRSRGRSLRKGCLRR